MKLREKEKEFIEMLETVMDEIIKENDDENK
ncbi:hypothetical protein HNP72_001099 [Sphingobacterium soli]|nr:hypothetical protein [Sphingobacterium soli]